MSPRRGLLSATGALLLLVLAAPQARAGATDPDAAAGESTAAWERLQREVDARRARLDAFARQEQGLLDTLEGIDRAVSRVARDVVLARRRAAEAQARLASSEEKARALEEQVAVTQAAVSARAVALYREGRAGPLRYLAGAGSLRELLGRVRALRRGLAQDAALLAQMRAERDALAAARAAAATAAHESDAALRHLAGRARALEEEHAAKGELLAGVRSDGTRERSALAELQAAAQRLEETLAQLGAPVPKHEAALPGPPFSSLRGRLKAPVAAPVARRFGRVVDADFHTAIFRKGFDFAAPAGATVHAVAPGEVRFAGWFRGYGKMVIVDHGEGYFTVSAHLDEIRVAVGDAVASDQPLGTVGDTGSLSGPLLYFEIRHDSTPVDPSRWLAGGTGLE